MKILSKNINFKPSFRIPWSNLIGLGVLMLLITRLDFVQVYEIIDTANTFLIILVVLMIFPLILVKTIRWQNILYSQKLLYPIHSAYLAYFSSLFIGLVTPGRLGEFVKAIYVKQELDIPLSRALSSVLLDRLFDLYILLLVGSMALLDLSLGQIGVTTLGVVWLFVILPLFFLNDTVFASFQKIGLKFGVIGQKLFASNGWIQDLHSGLTDLSLLSFLVAIGLTVVAYTIFFWQCYVLALALNMAVGFIDISYAIALGSLVTLIPISISGLGTREVTMVTYLSTVGISAEAALTFSLLVFTTFYIGGGLIGAFAWWVRPVSLQETGSE